METWTTAPTFDTSKRRRSVQLTFSDERERKIQERGCWVEMIELSLCSQLSCGCKWVEISLETSVCVCEDSVWKLICRCECNFAYVCMWTGGKTVLLNSLSKPEVFLSLSLSVYLFSSSPLSPSPSILSLPSLYLLTHLTHVYIHCHYFADTLIQSDLH